MIDWDALMPPHMGQDSPSTVPGMGQKVVPNNPEVGHDSDRKEVKGGTDLQTLEGEENPENSPKWDKVSHRVPPKKASVPLIVGQPNPSNEADYSRFFESVPLVPLKKQGRGKEDDDNVKPFAGEAADCSNLCAEKRQDRQGDNSEHPALNYPANPAAILLLLAWTKANKASRKGRIALLLNLETIPPADQIRVWHHRCLESGIKPWHVLCLPAPSQGQDCTLCKNLSTRHEAICSDRKQYHWACDQGYLILEWGKGTERIWIGPPECQSYERWYPSDWR